MLFDRLAVFAATPRAVVLVALWACAEALVLPVVPDIALGLLALAAPRRTLPLLSVAVVAALAGTVVLFAVTAWFPDAVGSFLVRLPGISPAMVAGAGLTVADGTPTSMALLGPGTPLKVFTYAWATGPATPAALGLGVVLNRLTRIGPLLAVQALAGRFAPGFLRRHDRSVVVAYTLFWLVIYARLWGFM